MKLGIVGAGKIVIDLLSFIHEIPDISVQGICGTSKSEHKLRDLQQQYEIPAIYTDFSRMLENDVDTIYVALPNHLHFPFVKQALLRDKHVICEKPFTSNLEEFLELQGLAMERGLILLEAITTLHLQNFKLIKEYMDSNSLGEIKIVQCNYSQYSSRYNAFKQGNILPAFNPDMSGGALMDINIYNIHWVVGLFGSPKRVNYLPNMERDIDTSGVLLLDYESFKAVCVGAKDSTGNSFCSIQGDQGTLQVNSPANTCESFVYTLNQQDSVNVNQQAHAHRMYEEFVKFEQIIANQDTETVKLLLEHSRRVMEVVQLAKDSAGLRFAQRK
ncbi:Gfo/Idh/MocA family protein [Bacillus horti]|uniref:Dehydrogenase n=1 Tax=Caldalkalibacillus horti TaxID=77523 RepID=A0ABT9VZS5_9BACI|nr:Gfo/Idh/MocA family oxidoreductase [Bacillus horti]MDQ0166484.1 putative dehydrogenase [Bacillus horti]